MKKTKSLYHGRRFPAVVISCAVRWYFRFSLSLRDIEELLLERGVVVTYEQQFRSEEHTSELQSPDHLVCRLLLEKKKTHDSEHASASNQQPNTKGIQAQST